MSPADVFRQDLAGLLHGYAGDRRRALRGGVACGQDLKIIALLERLAVEAETIPSSVVAACQADVGGEPLARCILRHRNDLLAEVGVLYWPSDATALVLWLTAHLCVGERPDDAPGDAPPDMPARAPDAPPAADARPPRPAPRAGRAWACDFSAGFGIVAPVLAVWHGNVAMDQRRDQAIVQTHTAVPALVVSDAPAAEGRGATASSDLVLAFQPAPGAAPCRVTMRSTLPTAPGQSMMVVPRSSVCEPPLLPAEIGNPTETLTLAVALLIGGLVSLKVWGWLSRPVASHATRAVWS